MVAALGRLHGHGLRPFHISQAPRQIFNKFLHQGMEIATIDGLALALHHGAPWATATTHR